MNRTAPIAHDGIERDSDSDINLTPMLDVVFIMLIFFIVTASFIRETGIDVDRPEGNPSSIQRDGNILIAISESNEIWIDRRLIDPRAVRPNIERLYAANPNASVIVQADKRSHTDTLVHVMDAARSAGIYNVAIAAESY